MLCDNVHSRLAISAIATFEQLGDKILSNQPLIRHTLSIFFASTSGGCCKSIPKVTEPEALNSTFLQKAEPLQDF